MVLSRKRMPRSRSPIANSAKKYSSDAPKVKNRGRPAKAKETDSASTTSATDTFDTPLAGIKSRSSNFIITGKNVPSRSRRERNPPGNNRAGIESNIDATGLRF